MVMTPATCTKCSMYLPLSSKDGICETCNIDKQMKVEKFDSVDSMSANVHGITMTMGKTKMVLSWSVIDQIAEVSEPHYFHSVVNEIAVMNDQQRKKLN